MLAYKFNQQLDAWMDNDITENAADGESFSSRMKPLRADDDVIKQLVSNNHRGHLAGLAKTRCLNVVLFVDLFVFFSLAQRHACRTRS